MNNTKLILLLNLIKTISIITKNDNNDYEFS